MLDENISVQSISDQKDLHLFEGNESSSILLDLFLGKCLASFCSSMIVTGFEVIPHSGQVISGEALSPWSCSTQRPQIVWLQLIMSERVRGLMALHEVQSRAYCLVSSYLKQESLLHLRMP